MAQPALQKHFVSGYINTGLSGSNYSSSALGSFLTALGPLAPLVIVLAFYFGRMTGMAGAPSPE